MQNINVIPERSKIIGFIKQDLLLERLELEDTGLSLDQIKDDQILLDDSGLALDSVDALDLLVGIEQKFNIKIEEITGDFIEKVCVSITTLVDFVVGELEKGKVA